MGRRKLLFLKLRISWGEHHLNFSLSEKRKSGKKSKCWNNETCSTLRNFFSFCNALWKLVQSVDYCLNCQQNIRRKIFFYEDLTVRLLFSISINSLTTSGALVQFFRLFTFFLSILFIKIHENRE